MTRTDLSARNQRLNPSRTPEEKAAFKAANLAQPKGVHFIPEVRTPETMPTPQGQSFRITWETPLGRFGWSDFVGCADMGEAVECFNASRLNGGNIPVDAQIQQIKPA